MVYPDVYCVKCKAHTKTEKKHTVVLQNSSRALKGVCPSCASEVYKIMPRSQGQTEKKFNFNVLLGALISVGVIAMAWAISTRI